jgi:hypothetical protein
MADEFKTLKASELIKQITDMMKQFGDRDVFMTDHAKGELPLDQTSIRFAEHVSVRKDRNATEAKTLNGRFYVFSSM